MDNGRHQARMARAHRPRMQRRRAWMVGLAISSIVFGTIPPASAAAPTPVPRSERRSPAVTALERGRVDLFWTTSSGRLAHQYRPANGWWSRRLSLGGRLRSQPAAVSWAPGRVDVFARGTDDTLQHRWYRNGSWSRWESLGGQLTSAPAVASWGSGRLDVFARGPDGTLLHRYYASGNGWSRWRARPGALTSSPAATSWGPGRIDVVARGADRRLIHRRFAQGRGWSRWKARGGDLRSQPAIASPGPGTLDVIARDAGEAMRLKRYVQGDGWTKWRDLGGRFVSGPSASASGDDVRIAAKRLSGRHMLRIRRSPSAAWRRWRSVDPYRPFRRLSTWVDVFDYAGLEPARAIAEMAANDVRTLFLSTARFNSAGDFHDAAEAGEWLDAAHAAGIFVVGWYPPAYGDMSRDVRRTVAIAEFTSPQGGHFDAVGVDIERLDEVTRAQFNTRLVEHLTRVRDRTDTMIAAIVPSPFTTDPGNNWEGFPWSAVGDRSEVVVPMALWSFRDGCRGSAVCPLSPDEVYAWVLDQVQRTRSLTGRRVTVEGGVDDPGVERTPVTAARVDRFVDAVIDGGAIGGSHYDFATTPAELWPMLARLNQP